MDLGRWERMQALFHRAADLRDAERAAFLDESCGGDLEMRAAIEAMLGEDARSSTLVDRDVTRVAQDVLGESVSLKEFGRYRIVSLLGEGGMGIVYLAERSDLGNLVAIKFLRDAWLSPARRQRFSSEQRTLAQLNHPGIARLYDADTLPDGTPWFAMEYVDGVPLTEYCRANHCPVKERLRLVRAVCEAVEYAHESGVIHRDLKPSNILVRRDGAVRLLDFGIARQIDRSGAPEDQTRTAFRPLTPAYAAPEQLRGEPVGVQTDVYALGVILYQLLSGRLPFDVSKKTPAEAAAIITTQDPRRPSMNGRRTGPNESWNDLDVMCLAAMDKDPQRRYKSAGALIRDIDHYLKNEPLEARPDSLGYTLSKFVRRHGRALAAVAGVLMVMVMATTLLLRHSPTNTRSVAVLPFTNATRDHTLDYLSVALANEITTTLGYTPYLSVRALEFTRKYVSADVDMQKAGRELRAGNIITGSFSSAGDQLRITVEMIDVGSNRLEWRDTFNVPARNRLAMKVRVASKTMRALVPLLGGTRESVGIGEEISESGTQPTSEEGYDLYLRAVALPLDAASIVKARKLLEKSVALDPGYGPAWHALAGKCQGQTWYAGGGAESQHCTEVAQDHAVALDPDNIFVISGTAMERTEQHQIPRAYHDVQQAIQRRPDSGALHLTLGYVLRYAGLLEEAEHECDTALLLDSQNGGLKSCAVAFMERGDYQRARDYLNLDRDTEWGRALLVDLLLREGNQKEALQARPATVPQWAGYDALLAFIEHRPEDEVAGPARALQPAHDPELNYWGAAHLAYTGQKEAALRLLKQAIGQGYCAHEALDRDTLLAKIRALPQFAEIRAASTDCQTAFLAEAGIPTPK